MLNIYLDRYGGWVLGELTQLYIQNIYLQVVIITGKEKTEPRAYVSRLVINCKPCHWGISSLKTSLTNLCCLITERLLNWLETILILYIVPQPPEMSCTCSPLGDKALLSLSKISLSCSVSKSSCRAPPLSLYHLFVVYGDEAL